MVNELGKGLGTTDNFAMELNCREGKEVEKLRDHQFPLRPHRNWMYSSTLAICVVQCQRRFPTPEKVGVNWKYSQVVGIYESYVRGVWCGPCLMHYVDLDAGNTLRKRLKLHHVWRRDVVKTVAQPSRVGVRWKRRCKATLTLKSLSLLPFALDFERSISATAFWLSGCRHVGLGRGRSSVQCALIINTAHRANLHNCAHAHAHESRDMDTQQEGSELPSSKLGTKE